MVEIYICYSTLHIVIQMSSWKLLTKKQHCWKRLLTDLFENWQGTRYQIGTNHDFGNIMGIDGALPQNQRLHRTHLVSTRSIDGRCLGSDWRSKTVKKCPMQNYDGKTF